MSSEITIVNVVASGSLPVELDLQQVTTDIGEPVAEYNPEKYPGMYLRFDDDGPLITVYRTGKYIITGSKSEGESYSLREKFLDRLVEMGIIEKATDEWFSIQNYVCTGDLDVSQKLSALAIRLGLEKTEYEPEQFPGLVYRPESYEIVILIFGTGKVVLTGAKDVQTAERAFDKLRKEVG